LVKSELPKFRIFKKQLLMKFNKLNSLTKSGLLMIRTTLASFLSPKCAASLLLTLLSLVRLTDYLRNNSMLSSTLLISITMARLTRLR
jgi:hypothetical protein